MPTTTTPDPTTTPPAAPKAPLSNPYGLSLDAPTTAPLTTEYPSAPSTTGTPQNRLQLAQTAFDTFAKSTAPAYAADLRQATQQAAGNGQVGSGMLRTTYGNLANQRALALDTERDNLINQATGATIADQQANRGLDIQQENADTSRLGTTGNLALGQGGLTLAQRNQALAELQNTQQFGLAQAAQDVATKVALGQLTLAQAAQALDEKVRTGELTLAQKDEALRELTQQQNNTNTQTSLQLQRDQLTQQGEQFGLSLAQQKDLADLADKTANRQIDATSAQGQNALLLELARIMGTSTSQIDPTFVAAISRALGIPAPTQAYVPPAPPPPGTAPGATPPPAAGYPTPGTPGYPVNPDGTVGSPYGS